MRDAETEIEREEGGGEGEDRREEEEKKERKKEKSGVDKEWGVDERQTPTLAAEEKVESMKLVVLAAPSIREKYPEGTTVGVSSPSSLFSLSLFLSLLVLFDNYANAGMIVGQYVLGIKVGVGAIRLSL